MWAFAVAKSSISASQASVLALLTKRFAEDGDGFFFGTLWYPYQAAAPVDDKFCTKDRRYIGEARGFYPFRDDPNDLSKGEFFAWNSFTHTKTSKTKTKYVRKHGGLDIYAPYFPFPFEIPIYALVTSKVLFRTRWRNLSVAKNKETQEFFRKFPSLGDRITQTVTFGTRTVHLDYGHLARFAGDDRGPRDRSGQRSVTAGELIGFAGKSGNADTRKESSTRASPFMMNSGHVHLSLRGDLAKEKLLDALPLPLAFHPDQKRLNLKSVEEEKQKRLNITAWNTPAGDRPVLRMAMPEATVAPAKLVEFKPQRPKRVKGRRGRYSKPFNHLDVDSSRILAVTHKAYTDATARIAVTSYKDKALAEWERLTDPDDKHHDKAYWGETVGALVNRAITRAAQAEAQTGPVIKGQGGHILVALMHLLEAQFILFGGGAFNALNEQSTSVSDPEREIPISGIGVRGRMFALAYPNAVCALHDARLMLPDAGNNKVRRTVFSVTFGAGGLRHATLCNQVVETEEYKGTASDIQNLPDDDKKELRRVFGGMWKTTKSLRDLYIDTYRHRDALSVGGPRPNSLPSLDAFKGRVAAVAGEMNLLAGLQHNLVKKDSTKKVLAVAILRALAKSNATAFAEARAISGQRKPQIPPAAQLFGLQLKPDDPKGPSCHETHHT